jgi:hypothetical protein
VLNNSAPVVYPHEGISTEHDRISTEDQQSKARAVIARRYRHQETAAGLLRHRRALQGCHRWVAFGKDCVELVSYPKLKKGKLKGLQSCGSPHICPVCAPKIAERRVRYDLEPGLQKARELGFGILVLTSTIRHQAKDVFEANLLGLLLARKLSRSGNWMTKMRKRYGIVGTIRAFECTYGVNGFHVHFHELVLFDHVLSLTESVQFEASMKTRWLESVVKAGLPAVTLEHGLHVSDTHAAIEEYIQKQLMGGVAKDDVKRPRWDLPQELAKQPVKAGRSQYIAGERVKGYSMFELLAIASEGEVIDGAPSPSRAAHIFREFDAAVTKHRVRQLYWSPGLKALLGVKDLTDEQIEALDEEDKEAELFATLAPPEISALVADGKRGELTSALAENNLPLTLSIIAPYVGVRKTSVVSVANPLLRLTDWNADERDFLPPVRAWADPLTTQLNYPVSLAMSLRVMNAWGERVHYFEELREQKQERQAHIPEVHRVGSPLGVIVKKHGRRGLLRFLCWLDVLAPGLDWSEEKPPVGVALELAL